MTSQLGIYDDGGNYLVISNISYNLLLMATTNDIINNFNVFKTKLQFYSF